MLTADEIKFDIDFALKQIGRQLLRDWATANELKSERARRLMVDRITAQLARYQVRAPAPLPNHGSSS